MTPVAHRSAAVTSNAVIPGNVGAFNLAATPGTWVGRGLRGRCRGPQRLVPIGPESVNAPAVARAFTAAVVSCVR
jgi:hypothetical protein